MSASELRKSTQPPGDEEAVQRKKKFGTSRPIASIACSKPWP
jgi:hypothetical protein